MCATTSSFIKNILDDETRRKLDQAWNDLYTSFEYHDHYWKLIAEHYHLTSLQSKHIGELTKADFDSMPAEARGYAASLRATYDSANTAEKAAQPRHIEDCLEFASRAWRRPLTEKEKSALRAFYQKTLAGDSGSRPRDPNPDRAHSGGARVSLQAGTARRIRNQTGVDIRGRARSSGSQQLGDGQPHELLHLVVDPG